MSWRRRAMLWLLWVLLLSILGAIAHDLRTPLTRLDKATEAERTKADADIEEMRRMLATLLSFVQTMQSHGPRQRQELRSRGDQHRRRPGGYRA